MVRSPSLRAVNPSWESFVTRPCPGLVDDGMAGHAGTAARGLQGLVRRRPASCRTRSTGRKTAPCRRSDRDLYQGVVDTRLASSPNTTTGHGSSSHHRCRRRCVRPRIDVEPAPVGRTCGPRIRFGRRARRVRCSRLDRLRDHGCAHARDERAGTAAPSCAQPSAVAGDLDDRARIGRRGAFGGDRNGATRQMKGEIMPSSAAPVYVVDDDSSVRESVGSLIRSAGWPVESFGSARQFLESRWVTQPGCVVLDLELPGMSGLELQRMLDPRFSVIFLTGRGDIPTSVRAMKAGAQEFLTKPPPEDELLEAIGRAIARTAPRPAQAGRSDALANATVGMIGTSHAFRRILDLLEAVAPTDATVLILGETGTGKERVARAVHDRSARRSKPFVSVNCAAIPQSLIASDLFGHEKGAFTGAVQRRAGRFEQAQGGTIFLDEVGDLPAETQVALLRVLQEREFERVGGQHPIAADVRVVAATNRD